MQGCEAFFDFAVVVEEHGTSLGLVSGVRLITRTAALKAANGSATLPFHIGVKPSKTLTALKQQHQAEGNPGSTPGSVFGPVV